MKGMRVYSIKSRSKRTKYFNRNNKNFSSYYYNFHTRTYEFENDEIAKKQFEILDQVSKSGEGYCNRNFNTQFVVKKNEIFEFETMDDKSINFMKNYIRFIENQETALQKFDKPILVFYIVIRKPYMNETSYYMRLFLIHLKYGISRGFPAIEVVFSVISLTFIFFGIIALFKSEYYFPHSLDLFFLPVHKKIRRTWKQAKIFIF